MTDDQLNEYPPHIAALLDDARPIDEAPASAKAAVRARVLATVGAAATATATTASVETATQRAPATTNVPSTSAGWLAAKGAWLAVGVAVIGLAIALFRGTKDEGARESRTHNRSAAVAAEDARAASALVAPSQLTIAASNDAESQAAVIEDASGSTVANQADAAVSSRVAPATDTLGEEQRLLDRARAALVSGEHAAALTALTRHKQRFSRGQLAMERDALEVRALLAAGREDEARRAAARFGSRWPTSPLRSAVEAMLR